MPVVLILRDGAKTPRLLRMIGEGRQPFALRRRCSVRRLEGPIQTLIITWISG